MERNLAFMKEKNYYNGITKHYFLQNLKTINQLIEEGPVLDYGCGTKELQKITQKEYYGYDKKEPINLQEIQPKTIVASHVLEHMAKQELEEFLDYCEEKGIKKLITSLPLENTLSKTLATITGWREKNKEEHKQDWKQVTKAIEKRFNKTKTKTVYLMSIINEWESRTKE